MDPRRAQADAAVAWIAARHHGVLTLAQLRSAGLTDTQIKGRVRSGRIHRIHRGVYAVGHRGLSHHGRWLAAVLACGGGAALSHRAAAELYTLLPSTRGVIDVTVPGRGGRSKRPHLRVHRSSLPETATTTRHGIRVTTPARTLADLKRVVLPGVHRKALRQSEYLRLPIGEIVTDGTRSELERDFLRLCHRHHLPRPEVNVAIGPFTVDFLWPDARLVVETDTYRTHGGAQAFEDDYGRDLELHRRGYRVRRFTDAQVYHQPEAVAEVVKAAVAGARLTG